MTADRLENTDYDLIVIGTGFAESLVASAAARAGKRVLHLDAASTYGTHWAALHLDEFLAWVTALQTRGRDVAVNGHAPDDEYQSDAAARGWDETPIDWHGAAAGPSGIYSDVQLWTDSSADAGPSREYNIDLAPKVATCAGSLVRALVQSGAHNYVEFKLLQGSYVWRDGTLLPVPATKADVFRTRALSGGDKRSLMRFLSACASAEQGNGHLKDAFGDQPFVDLLDSEGLSPQLQDFLLYAIVLCDSAQRSTDAQPSAGGTAHSSAAPEAQAAASASLPAADVGAMAGAGPPQLAESQSRHAAEAPMTAAEARRALRLYQASAGKYAAGGSAFMAPVYGVGELPQAFCRVAAVAGATYVLRHAVAALLADAATGECVGVRTVAGQTLRCGALATDEASLREMLRRHADDSQDDCTSDAEQTPGVARAVCIMDASLEEGISQLFAVMPPRALPGSNDESAIRILQVGQATCASPSGRYVLYLETPSLPGRTAEQLLRPAVDALTRQQPPETTAEDIRQSAAACQGSGRDSSASPPVADGPLPAAAHSVKSDPQEHARDARPRLLLAAYYYSQRLDTPTEQDALPSNVAFCGAPDGSLDFASALQAAEQCFSRLFPSADASFLSSVTPGTGEDSDDESDEETIEALQAALGGLGSRQIAEHE